MTIHTEKMLAALDGCIRTLGTKLEYGGCDESEIAEILAPFQAALEAAQSAVAQPAMADDDEPTRDLIMELKDNLSIMTNGSIYHDDYQNICDLALEGLARRNLAASPAPIAVDRGAVLEDEATVERVARAICKSNGHNPEEICFSGNRSMWQEYQLDASAAIRSLASPSVSEVK